MLSVFLIVLLAVVDLSLTVIRTNALCEAARRLARTAAVRGDSAAPHLPSWGPGAISATADDASEYAHIARSCLATMEPSQVQITLEWPDAGNTPGDRIRVNLAFSQQSLVPYLFGTAVVPLEASSTIRIAH